MLDKKGKLSISRHSFYYSPSIASYSLCLMGPIYPKRLLSKPDKHHKKYPYLLRGVSIVRPNQVWSIDIAYIHLKHGLSI